MVAGGAVIHKLTPPGCAAPPRSLMNNCRTDIRMSAFVDFEYDGTLPRTSYSANQVPYRHVVQLVKRDSDGHDRSDLELRNAAEILIRNTLEESAADAILAGPMPKEIARERFDRMTKVRRSSSSIPGGVYKVVRDQRGNRAFVTADSCGQISPGGRNGNSLFFS
jgi:hypothetical protein